MSKTFKFRRKYYEDRMLYKKGSVTIEPGVTVLVGCNGSGKSTMQSIIQSTLNSENITFISYDNEKDGGHHSRSFEIEFGDISKGLNMAFSSEGENISINLCGVADDLRDYIRTGKHETFASKLHSIFMDTPKVDNTGNQRWLFFDAVEDGLFEDTDSDYLIFEQIWEQAETDMAQPYA